MENKKKGLVDDREHGFILNESGTSVTTDAEAVDQVSADETSQQPAANNDTGGAETDPDVTAQMHTLTDDASDAGNGLKIAAHEIRRRDDLMQR